MTISTTIKMIETISTTIKMIVTISTTINMIMTISTTINMIMTISTTTNMIMTIPTTINMIMTIPTTVTLHSHYCQCCCHCRCPDQAGHRPGQLAPRRPAATSRPNIIQVSAHYPWWWRSARNRAQSWFLHRRCWFDLNCQVDTKELFPDECLIHEVGDLSAVWFDFN